ncbi:protein kinase domain-containing protein [Streptomyces hebeiensis]
MPDSSSLTRTGDLIGSPDYIAPERIRGRDDDPASDLWSLGVVLYVRVEGAGPLRRATALATLAAVLDEPVRPGPGRVPNPRAPNPRPAPLPARTGPEPSGRASAVRASRGSRAPCARSPRRRPRRSPAAPGR